MGGGFIVDIGNFDIKLNRWFFPQIVDRGSGNLYPIYIKKIVVLAAEPVGGRSRATELPSKIKTIIADLLSVLITLI